MSIGFMGTGVIAEAVITGLLNSNNAPEKVVVSPRNAVRAAALASKYAQVRVAESNQAVVDACDTVCLSIRPEIADSVLGELAFRRVFPSDREVEKIFGGIGTIIRAQNADQFLALWATTAMLAHNA